MPKTTIHIPAPLLQALMSEPGAENPSQAVCRMLRERFPSVPTTLSSTDKVRGLLSDGCWYSLSDIASATGCSRMTVRWRIAQLVASGSLESKLLSPQQQEQGRPATVYRLVAR